VLAGVPNCIMVLVSGDLADMVEQWNENSYKKTMF
jgi:hypothetical protein